MHAALPEVAVSMARPLAGCLAVALLSLLAPTVPSSDGWAWLLWGREITELALDTTNGPSWKPLPVVFTTPLSILGDAQPYAWLVVARTGGLLALVLTYRLTARLVAVRVADPWVLRTAAVLAAAGLVLTDWFGYVARGEAEPLVLAFLLWAVERHLDGHPRQALGLLLLAALGRPEVWPLLGLFWIWAWLRVPGSRAIVAGSAAVLAVLWFGVDWWGSGQPLLAGERANRPTPSSLADADRPALAVTVRATRLIMLPLLLLALAGFFSAVRERRRVALSLAIAAAAWTLIVAVLTEAGYTGNERYLFPVAGAVCVLAGVGTGWLLQSARGSAGGRVARVLAVVAAVAILASLPLRAAELLSEARETRNQQQAWTDLRAAVDGAGGPAGLLARGRPAITRGGYQSTLAWELGVPLAAVGRPFPPRELLQLEPPNVILDAALTRVEDRRRRPWLGRPDLTARVVAVAGFWRVVEVRRRAPAPRGESGAATPP